MTDLTPITALGGTSARVQKFGALTISENTELGLASLSLRSGQSAPSPFGLILPDVGRSSAIEGFAAFWTATGQWMIEANGQADRDFAKALKSEAPQCSVTEQTDGFVAFEIESIDGAGPINDVMAKLVNIDPLGFDEGSALRTGLEHISVFLVRRSAGHIAVIGMRTLADSLWHALSTAAARQNT